MILVLLVGCMNDSPPPPKTAVHERNLPTYSPLTFRDDVTKLISEKRFNDAVEFINGVDPNRQADHDKAGYFAVAEELIVLPGVYPEVEYDNNRDWEFPGTSDAVESAAWQQAATGFAKSYNLQRYGR